MNDFKQQMPQFDIDPKKIGKYVAIGVVGLILVVFEDGTTQKIIRQYIFIIKVIQLSYGFVFKIISLVLAVCCPIIMITMFPLRSSLSWYWDTPAVPLFILTTIPTSYFFLTTTGWKLPGICLFRVEASRNMFIATNNISSYNPWIYT